MEACALVDLAFCPDPAIMALDDAAHTGKANPCALEVFHAVQALEYTEQLACIGHVEAHAIVANADLGFARMQHRTDRDVCR